MARKKKINDVDRFYIEQNPKNLTVEQLGDLMNIEEESIEKVIEAAKTRKDTLMNKLVSTHKRKGKPVAATMTKEASQLADSVRQNYTEKINPNVIHKPKG